LKKSYDKRSDRTYLSAVHGFRDKHGRVKQTTIKTFGYLEALKKEHDDPISYYKAEVKKLEKQQAEENGDNTIRFKASEVLGEQEDNSKNIGYAPLSLIYHELGLNRFYGNRDKTKNGYSLNQVVKNLVYSRILNPASKRKTTKDKDFFFEDFDFTLDNVYDCLPVIKRYKNDLQKHLNQKVSQLYKRDSELVYYDVTNYYFEIDEPDKLRKKGVSKEHRPDPIVQMGLLMDQNALPIAFDLYPGNTRDCQTLMPSLAKSRADFGLEKIIVVADKGLNSSENIVATVAKGDGYVFSATVRGASAGMQKWVLDEKDYLSESEDRKYKSAIFTRKVKVPTANGKTKLVELEEKRVAIYSEKYARKAKRDREAAVEKARMMAQNEQNYERLLDKTAAKYIKNNEYNKLTGEILKKGKDISFDEERLAEEEKYDGYYMIVTSEIKKSALEIMDIYSGLWQIEESFRITKSELKARPVYLQKPEHIEAHFTVCFIALLILRILQIKLNYKYSPARLIESMNKAMVAYEGDGWWLSLFHDEVIGDFAKKLNINLTQKRHRKNELNRVINQTKNW
jgi:transposase